MEREKNHHILQYFFLLLVTILSVFVVMKFSKVLLLEESKKIIFTHMKEGETKVYERALEEFIPLKKLENQDEKSVIFMNHMVGAFVPTRAYVKENASQKTELIIGESKVPDYFLEGEETYSEEAKQQLEEDEKIAASTKKTAVSYTKKQLNDFEFLKQNFYVVDSTTTITKKELNGEKLLNKDLSIKKNTQEKDKPIILIYHTHGSETFADSRPGKKEDTVIGVGDELARILEEKYGYQVYHDRTVYDMINGKLDRNRAYNQAGKGLEKNLKKYPSIQVVIDLHRDGVGSKTRLVTNINGKKTAKIMFFNGISRTAKNGDIAYLKNPNKEGNLAFSLQLQLAANERYGDFTRKIYIKGYRYNMHYKERSLLAECGAQTNTVEEVKNAMEPFADILNQVLKE